MKLKIISIGPGDPSLINEVTIQAIRTADPLVLRTGHHSLTHWLKTSGVSFQTLDYLYETSSDFDLLTKAAAERLWALASDNPETVLAVPDSMTDHIVDELYASCPENGELECIPGFSFADFYLPACRPFFSTSDIRICPAASFTESGYDPSRPILVTELNDSITAGIIKQQLSSCIRDEETIVFLNGDASASPIPLFELDRQSEYNHLSALRMKPLPGLPDAFLELEHHGAGTVNEVDSDALGVGICLRRFPVRPDKQGFRAGILDAAEVLKGNSDQTLFPEPFQLRFIVDYGTE